MFMLLSLICLFLTIFLILDWPILSIPVILMGMIFSILSTYGLWSIEKLDTGYNSTTGVTETVTTTLNYGDPYSYIFMIIFFIFSILFLYASFLHLRYVVEERNEEGK